MITSEEQSLITTTEAVAPAKTNHAEGAIAFFPLNIRKAIAVIYPTNNPSITNQTHRTNHQLDTTKVLTTNRRSPSITHQNTVTNNPF